VSKAVFPDGPVRLSLEPDRACTIDIDHFDAEAESDPLRRDHDQEPLQLGRCETHRPESPRGRITLIDDMTGMPASPEPRPIQSALAAGGRHG
jgi:hypothetical protein